MKERKLQPLNAQGTTQHLQDILPLKLKRRKNQKKSQKPRNISKKTKQYLP